MGYHGHVLLLLQAAISALCWFLYQFLIFLIQNLMSHAWVTLIFYGSYQRDGLMVHVSICTMYVISRDRSHRCAKLARHRHNKGFTARKEKYLSSACFQKKHTSSARRLDVPPNYARDLVVAGNNVTQQRAWASFDAYPSIFHCSICPQWLLSKCNRGECSVWGEWWDHARSPSTAYRRGANLSQCHVIDREIW